MSNSQIFNGEDINDNFTFVIVLHLIIISGVVYEQRSESKKQIGKEKRESIIGYRTFVSFPTYSSVQGIIVDLTLVPYLPRLKYLH